MVYHLVKKEGIHLFRW